SPDTHPTTQHREAREWTTSSGCRGGPHDHPHPPPPRPCHCPARRLESRGHRGAAARPDALRQRPPGSLLLGMPEAGVCGRTDCDRGIRCDGRDRDERGDVPAVCRWDEEPMPPSYDDGRCVIYHGDCRELLPVACDAVVTDPPYNAQTHEGARTDATGEVGALVDFASISTADLRDVLALAGRGLRGWMVATMAYQHAVALEDSPPDGLRFVRLGVWVKTNPAPQFTGDRPAQGWEAIAYLHTLGGRMEWNGGGRTGNYVSTRAAGLHPTQKPVDL